MGGADSLDNGLWKTCGLSEILGVDEAINVPPKRLCLQVKVSANPSYNNYIPNNIIYQIMQQPTIN